MKIFERPGFYLEIENDVFDADIYRTIVEKFKSMRFYKSADFILPVFVVDGITIKAVGEVGVNYKVVFDDTEFEFVETQDLKLVGDLIESRKIVAQVYMEGQFLGSTGIAFVHYILYAYVAVIVYLEFAERLKEAKESRYLIENVDYAEGFSDYFGVLYGLQRINGWSLDSYREVILQLISAMKNPITESSLKDVETSLGFNLFAQDIKKLCEMSGGFTKIDNERWQTELL